MQKAGELTLNEQGRSSRFVTLLELPEKGLQVLADEPTGHALV